MHELTHGLGFRSALRRNNNENYMTTSHVRSLITGGERKLPINKYDTLIHSGSDSIGELGRVFETRNKPRKLSEFLAKIQRLYEIAINAGAVYVFPDGTNASVYTIENEYKGGSSLQHLARDYITSSDFLMNPKVLKGETLNSMMLKSNSTLVYGPITLKILQEIGWSTYNEPSLVDFMDIESDPYADD